MTRRTSAGRPVQGGWRLSRKVRIRSIRVNELRPKDKKPYKTYTVRWKVETQEHQATFATRTLADRERSMLVGCLDRGESFDVESGKPESLLQEQRRCGWLDHAMAYAAMKWPAAAPKSRTGNAETLTAVTLAFVKEGRSRPGDEVLRAALYGWAFVPPTRAAGPPAPEHAAAIDWIARHTIDLADLADPLRGPMLARSALDALAVLLDGSTAAASTFARKRAVFYNCLEYGVELGFLPSNPIDRVKWATPKLAEAVDSRVVVNHHQATALLCAVALLPGVARRLVAFFACMYYAALRPGEALDLRIDNLGVLPATGWGEFVLTNSSPRSGKAWTNSGKSRDRRGLKHRADKETRRVPMHPILAEILRAHLETFGTAPDGRLFIGPRGGTIGDSTYTGVWQKARTLALTPSEARSPLAGRPYDLRHAAVSTWLNAGVGAPQVAEWAGHSVTVLLRVYAKCIDGQGGAARRRIEDAMSDQ